MNKEERIKEVPYNVFVAIDGTEFPTESSCKNYEESVESVLLNKLLSIEINRIESEDELFLCGNDENSVRVLMPKTEQDIDNINLLGHLHNKNAHFFTKEDIDTIILLHIRIYSSGVDYLWFDSLNQIVDKATNGAFSLRR